MIEDDEALLRLVWNTRDFDRDTGKIKGAAFSKSDLVPFNDKNGHPRYVSMDMKCKIEKASVDWLIARGKEEAQKRIDPRFAEFNCGELRGLTSSDGQQYFEVFPAPIEAEEIEPGSPQNRAHVGVRSTSPDPADDDARYVKVDELRTQLLKLANRSGTLPYSSVFPA